MKGVGSGGGGKVGSGDSGNVVRVLMKLETRRARVSSVFEGGMGGVEKLETRRARVSSGFEGVGGVEMDVEGDGLDAGNWALAEDDEEEELSEVSTSISKSLSVLM